MTNTTIIVNGKEITDAELFARLDALENKEPHTRYDMIGDEIPADFNPFKKGNYATIKTRWSGNTRNSYEGNIIAETDNSICVDYRGLNSNKWFPKSALTVKWDYTMMMGGNGDCVEFVCAKYALK